MFAAEIYDQNAKLVEIGMEPINLTSVMIGALFPVFVDFLVSYAYVSLQETV